MKLKSYPEYKDSEFEQANIIPADWEKVRLGTIFKFFKGFGLSKSSLDELGAHKCVLYGELFTRYKKELVLDELSSRTSEDDGFISFGDEILIPASTTTVGEDLACAKALNVSKARIGGDVIILRPKSDNVYRPFYCYFIEVVNKCDFARNSKGVTIVHIYADGLKNMTTFLPSYDEQIFISKFLDRETSKLDTLISKQEKLIELLQEKRQSIISHAVTKGLNPEAKMKDSGVEWLGMVPEDWGVASIKWFTKIYSGGTPDKSNDGYWENGTVPWLNSGSVNADIITQASDYITEEAFKNSSAKWIPKDSLVIALAGQGKTKGMVAQLAIDTTCNQSMAAIIPTSKITSRFLFWWLKSNYQNIRNLAGGDLRDGLNLEMIGGIYAPLPLFLEQVDITNFLDNETLKIDTLIDKAKRSVELAKEHRTALISAAVTGKIDVREAA